MNWKALIDEECPRCGANLGDIEDDMVTCSDEDCTFSITREKMDELLVELEDDIMDDNDNSETDW